jgi:hypothetical protein
MSKKVFKNCNECGEPVRLAYPYFSKHFPLDDNEVICGKCDPQTCVVCGREVEISSFSLYGGDDGMSSYAVCDDIFCGEAARRCAAKGFCVHDEDMDEKTCKYCGAYIASQYGFYDPEESRS